MHSHFTYLSHEDALEINRAVIDSQSAGAERQLHPGALLEMQSLWFHLRPARSETQGGA